jgi:hypothetical protein
MCAPPVGDRGSLYTRFRSRPQIALHLPYRDRGKWRLARHFRSGRREEKSVGARRQVPPPIGDNGRTVVAATVTNWGYRLDPKSVPGGWQYGSASPGVGIARGHPSGKDHAAVTNRCKRSLPGGRCRHQSVLLIGERRQPPLPIGGISSLCNPVPTAVGIKPRVECNGTRGYSHPLFSGSRIGGSGIG